MNTLYLDPFSGISGDMFVAALIDLGVDLHRIEHELAKLPLSGYHLHAGRGTKGTISGIKFDVHLAAAHSHGHQDDAHHHESHSHAHPHRHSHGEHEHEHEHVHEHAEERTFQSIRELIGSSKLSPWVKEKAIAVFKRIAEAEGRIHGVPAEEVHFHEVGAVDSIVDIVGGCIALEALGKPRVLAGPLVEGTGWINCDHGRFPIPAPATLAILGARGIAVSQCDEPNELITPTGAALAAELVESFGPMHNLVAKRIGFGLGTRDSKTRPNVLRVIYGETVSQPTSHDWETDTVAVIETNLDDISPEILGDFVERALAAGALDVFNTPIQMKKNRPGVLVTVLCAEGRADEFCELMLRHTSAFGVRCHLASRRKLRREFVTVDTPHGPIPVKVGKLDDKTVHAAPEFEACRALAAQARVPLNEVYEAAAQAFRSRSE